MGVLILLGLLYLVSCASLEDMNLQQGCLRGEQDRDVLMEEPAWLRKVKKCLNACSETDDLIQFMCSAKGILHCSWSVKCDVSMTVFEINTKTNSLEPMGKEAYNGANSTCSVHVWIFLVCVCLFGSLNPDGQMSSDFGLHILIRLEIILLILRISVSWLSDLKCCLVTLFL